jgi:hypothetical protein
MGTVLHFRTIRLRSRGFYGEVGSGKIVQIRYKFFPLVQVPLLAGSHAPWAPHA